MNDCANKSWHAVYLKSRHEFKVEKKLTETGIDHFLPVIERIRQWKDRKKKVSFPLFPGYIFVHIPDDYDLVLAVLKTAGVVRILSAKGKPVRIPDEQIIALQKLIENKHPIDPHPYISKGQRVRIKTGPLAGIEGILMEKQKQNLLVLAVDLLKQGASVKIDAFDIEPA